MIAETAFVICAHVALLYDCIRPTYVQLKTRVTLVVVRVYVRVVIEADSDADVGTNEQYRRDKDEESVIGGVRHVDLQQVLFALSSRNRRTDNMDERVSFGFACQHTPTIYVYD